MVCKMNGCERAARKAGYCPRCYAYQRLQSPDLPRCSVEGCDLAATARGWCGTHYKRARRNNGDPLGVGRGSPGKPRGIRSMSGSYVTAGGYRKVRRPGGVGHDGWVLEHRLVMEGELGRRLLPGENVHHINGDKLDNRPENLELWLTRQPQGQRVTDALAWAQEIVARYG